MSLPVSNVVSFSTVCYPGYQASAKENDQPDLDGNRDLSSAPHSPRTYSRSRLCSVGPESAGSTILPNVALPSFPYSRSPITIRMGLCHTANFQIAKCHPSITYWQLSSRLYVFFWKGRETERRIETPLMAIQSWQ